MSPEEFDRYLVVTRPGIWFTLTAVGLASVIINIFMSRYISSKRVNITRIQTRDAGKLESNTVSGIDMIETLKACGAEDGSYEELLSKNGLFTELVKRQLVDRK